MGGVIGLIISISTQVYVFLSCILGGLLVGLLFDIFRLSRKYMSTKDIFTYIEDIIFWILVGIIVLMTVFLSNNGQIRGYVFLGIILGVVFYFMLLSSLVMKSLSWIIDCIVNLIVRIVNIIRIPVRFMVKVVKMFYGPLKYIARRLKFFEIMTVKLYRAIISWSKKLRRSKKIIKEKM